MQHAHPIAYMPQGSPTPLHFQQRMDAGLPALVKPVNIELESDPRDQELGAQCSEAEALWGALEAHLGRVQQLETLLQGVVGSEVHPHAIDGAKLRDSSGCMPQQYRTWAGEAYCSTPGCRRQ